MTDEPRKSGDNISGRLHDQDKDDRTKRDQKTSRQARRSENESASRRTTKTSKERKPTNSTEPSIHHTQHHIGLPATVPKEWLQTLKVDIPREAGHSLLIDVTKQLLVRKYDGGDELEYGDFIRKVNGRKVNTRAELVAILEELKCPSAPHTAVITVVRPRRKMEIPEHRLFMYLPNTNETVPGFTYFHVGLVLAPGARLGVAVRSFKNKVYVTRTDNDWNCIARRSLLMGDAILKVGDVDVTGIDAFKDAVTKAFGDEKGALLLVERPFTAGGVKLVKLALMAEKVPDPNPPIPKDVWAIASFQLAWMKAHPGEEPAFSLLPEDQPGFGSPGPSGVRQATLGPDSKELAIGTDTENPALLQPVPASPSAHQFTNSAHHVKHAKK